MANIITCCRIAGSILLLCFPAFSPGFYVLYLVCGFTDMIDGTIARRTNAVSEFGSKLDTFADFVFVVTCLSKLLPVLHIPRWLWIWTAVIAMIKVANAIFGLVCRKQLLAVHSMMNKATGFVLFLLPLTVRLVDLKYSAPVVCSIATLAAVQEGRMK
ncbi:MAG: CDP-alcohol phosphatidyltransferase family protein [Lachnospiraceae bacterium]